MKFPSDIIELYKGETYNKKILYAMYNHKLRLGDKLYYYNDLVDINGKWIGQLFTIEKIGDKIYEDLMIIGTRKPASGYGNIYKINNVKTNKVYIGKTNDLYKRKNKHVYDLYHGIHNNKEMQKDFNLYGLSPFYFEILDQANSKEEMDIREKYWIEKFNSYTPNGYNKQLPKGKEKGRANNDRN